MSDRVKKKWLAVGLIWLGVVLTTFYNFAEVDRINALRLQKEILGMDARFVTANKDPIEAVTREKALLTHSVDSPGMGLMTLENKIDLISKDCGFSNVVVEDKIEDTESQDADISLYLSGSLTDLVRLLMKLQSEMPYTSLKHLEFDMGTSAGTPQFQLIMKYRYALTEPGTEE